MIGLTENAVRRYATRFRPDLGPAEARADLEQLVQQAVPMRRRTLNKDGQVYVVNRDGANITMIVRDNVVVTVLEPGAYQSENVSADAELIDESEQTREACRRMIEGDLEPGEVDRLRAARDLIARWRDGASFSIRALRRAHEVLGMRYDGRQRP